MLELLIKFGLVFIFYLNDLTMSVSSRLSHIGVDISGPEILEVISRTILDLFSTREVDSQIEP